MKPSTPIPHRNPQVLHFSAPTSKPERGPEVFPHFAVQVACLLVDYGRLWQIMVYYGRLWYIIVDYGILWYIMVYYGRLWYIVEYYGILWYIMEYYGILRLKPRGYTKGIFSFLQLFIRMQATLSLSSRTAFCVCFCAVH